MLVRKMTENSEKDVLLVVIYLGSGERFTGKDVFNGKRVQIWGMVQYQSDKIRRN